jgi:ABC-type phosphate transport system permease subunit
MASAPVSTELGAAAATRARRVTLTDRIAHGGFIAVSALSLGLIIAIAAFVVTEAWPSFAANGLRWFTDGPVPLDVQLSSAFSDGSTKLRAWPALYGTILTTGGALLVAFPFALLAAIFVAEIAPRAVARVLEPIVSLLAATPSVIFGLFAILILAPQIDSHLIDPGKAGQLAPVVTLTGASFLLGLIVLAVMIAPIMIAIFVDALRAVPVAWSEGAIALGCDRWRAARRVSLIAIRPALVAGTGLAIGRAVGEAIALSMASGSLGFTPNILDGLYFFVEPVRPLAAAIVDYSEGFDQPALRADLFAFGAILLITTAALTLAARLVSHPLERRLQGRD